MSRLLAGTTLIVAGAGVVVYQAVKVSLEEQFDRNLADRVQGLASILFQTEDEVHFEFSDELMPEYESATNPSYFQLTFEDGTPLEVSNSLGEEELFPPEIPDVDPSYWSEPLPDGRPGRLVAQLIEIHHVYPEWGPNRPEAAKVVVVVGRGTESLVAAQGKVMGSCVGGSLLLITLIAILAWVTVERGLEPTRRLASTLDAISVNDLPESLETGPLPSELTPVADKADLLIRRVDKALQRERRTTADIAHELRTPIAELITSSEVALRNGEDLETTMRALITTREIAWKMGGSVSTLLKLARLEMGTESFEKQPVELTPVLQELLRSIAEPVRDRKLVVVNRIPEDTRVQGDGEVIRIVLSNLLGNAVYHSSPHSTIECQHRNGGSNWSVAVENEAPNLEDHDLELLTQPFWRKDSARTDRERSGLGLALSSALAAKAGCELRFEFCEGRFRATLNGPQS